MKRDNHISVVLRQANKFSAGLSEYIDSKEAIYSADKKHDFSDYEPRTILVGNIKKVVAKVYKALNLSALSGEYVYNEKHGDELNAMQKIFSDCMAIVPETDLFEYEAAKIYRFVSFLKLDIEVYKRQIHFYTNSVIKPKKILLDYDTYTEDSLKDDKELSLKKYSKIFRNNLRLINIDREITLEFCCFSRINETCHELEKLNEDIKEKYVLALIHKCKLLENKFYFRGDIEPYLSFYNYYNGEDKEIELSVNEISYVSKRLREINTRDHQKYENCIKNAFYKFDIPQTSFDYFVACHYYKNIVKDKCALETLIEQFKNCIDKQDLSFDKRNSYACMSYLMNCLLSFEFKYEQLTLNDVKAKVGKVISFQKQHNVENYFPYYKAALWYNQYILQALKDSDYSDDLQQCIQNLTENIELSENCLKIRLRDAGSFIPFKPFFDECIEEFKAGAEIFPIFIYTSFVVPVDADSVMKELNDLRSKVSTIDSMYKTGHSISEMQKSLKKLKDEYQTDLTKNKALVEQQLTKANTYTRNEIDQNLKRSIEILSIFSAIVVFASGSIQIFTGSESIKQAAILMVMFAGALGLVGLFVRNCFVSRKEWVARDWAYLAALVTICIITALGTFGSWDKTIEEPLLNKSQTKSKNDLQTTEPLKIKLSSSASVFDQQNTTSKTIAK